MVCVGSHGLELEPQADRWRRTLAAFAADAPWPPDEVEVKGLAVAFHFRGWTDEAEAIRAARRDRRVVAGGGTRCALRAEDPRGAAAGRFAQGNGGAAVARGARPAESARGRRRYDRHRLLRSAGRARSRGARRRRIDRSAACTSRRSRHRRRFDRRVPRPPPPPLALPDESPADTTGARHRSCPEKPRTARPQRVSRARDVRLGHVRCLAPDVARSDTYFCDRWTTTCVPAPPSRMHRSPSTDRPSRTCRSAWR